MTHTIRRRPWWLLVAVLLVGGCRAPEPTHIVTWDPSTGVRWTPEIRGHVRCVAPTGGVLVDEDVSGTSDLYPRRYFDMQAREIRVNEHAACVERWYVPFSERGFRQERR